MRTAVVWFRRDLRVHDHPALATAAREYERVVPLFVFDPALLHGRFASDARSTFMLGCLGELDEELRQRGGKLVTRVGDPTQRVTALASQVRAEAVLWSKDVSPYAERRDHAVTLALRSAGIEARPQEGNYVLDPAGMATNSGTPYRVFSPFFRAWQQRGRRQLESAPAALVLPDSLDAGELPRSAASLGLGSDAGEVANPVVNPGERAARDATTRWLADHLPEYAARHNDVAEQGTSCLSPYLRWGCLSAAEIEHRARQHGGSGADAWIRQLAWRDFYAHVLLNWPDNLRVEFQEKMRALEREQPEQHLPNWRRGETGYPIVDAGMRQLAQTGWMHNRVRLIV
ncbi:MAG: deoxyribodipyrimidine photo-lyase, partial [Solirubrobacterales bacterium]|nr:deoxyribodipyrimidine photo-lyase [Solirubrobacterales bacterium]